MVLSREKRKQFFFSAAGSTCDNMVLPFGTRGAGTMSGTALDGRGVVVYDGANFWGFKWRHGSRWRVSTFGTAWSVDLGGRPFVTFPIFMPTDKRAPWEMSCDGERDASDENYRLHFSLSQNMHYSLRLKKKFFEHWKTKQPMWQNSRILVLKRKYSWILTGLSLRLGYKKQIW